MLEHTFKELFYIPQVDTPASQQIWRQCGL